MSNWTKYATNFYRQKKRTNKSYKFKDALKEAAKSYKRDKRSGGASASLGSSPFSGGSGAAGPIRQRRMTQRRRR